MMLAPSIDAAKKNTEAFTRLYDFYINGTYRYLEFRSKTIEDAEDLTSQVWETVLKNIVNFKSNNHKVFKAWLYTITRNTLYQYYRSNADQKENIDAEKIEYLLPQEDTPLKMLSKKDQTTQLKILINSLSEKQQEVVLLKFFSDFRNKEIAKILHTSEKTVASNLCRALETLKQQWEKLQ